ncbi:major facilitator superfamily domain-containing protein [Gongronella butleri]|nr:major facilitator superfamily domain-containing protein [Gongronella butleri]
MDEKVEKIEKLEIEEGDQVAIMNDTSKSSVFVKSPAEKKLFRRMLWIVLPFVWCVIFVTFVDKAMLSVAAVNGLLEDANMDTTQYSWVSAIVYLGTLVYQVPNNVLMQRLPLAPYLGTLLILWGVTVMATAFANTFEQLMGLRFLLGLFEAGCYPILYIILNTLFRRSEQHFVYAFTLFSSGSGTVIGTALGYVIILTLDNKQFAGMGPWRAWRWGYFVFGIVTIFIGAIVFFFMPDKADARVFRLSEEEKTIVAERANDNMVSRTRKIKRAHIWEALKEYRFWATGCVNLLLSMENTGMISYAVILVQYLGFSAVEASMLQVPSGAVAAVFALVASLSIRLSGQQIYPCLVFLVLASVGYIVLLASKAVASQLTGFYLTWAATGSMVVQLSIISNNTSGYTKKITYYSFYVALGQIGSFIGPFCMVPPTYVTAYSTFIAVNVVCVLLLLGMRVQMSRENSRRQRFAVPPPEVDENGLPPDLTDKENLAYRYTL